MTNKIAIVLGAVIVIALILDAVLQDSEGILFLMRKLTHMIEWLAFWR